MALPLKLLRGPRLRAMADWFSHVGQPIALATAATCTLVLGGRTLGLLQGIELAAYDQLIRLRPAAAPDDRFLIVGITEADIQSRQEWPMADQTFAEALDILLAAEPRVVALDIFRDVPMEPGREELLDIFATRGVLAVCKINSADNAGIAPPSATPAEQVGFSDLVVDAGGTLRRSLIAAGPPEGATSTGEHLCNTPGTQLFALSLQLALAYLSTEGYTAGLTADQQIQIGEVVLTQFSPQWGGYRNGDAAGYQLMLNYRAVTDGVPQVSLGELLAGEVPPEMIRDRMVLIGATTPEAKDMFYTPYSGGLRDSQQMPGVMVHAQAASQLVSAVLDGRPLIWSWPEGAETGWIVLWTLAGGIFAAYVRRPLWFALGAIAAAGTLYGVCVLVLVSTGGWIPLVPAGLGAGLAAVGVALGDRFNKSAYGQAVYRQVKSLLRLNIEIDMDQVEQQVSEITESEYFNQLQQRAQDLRHHRDGQQSAPKDPRPNAPPTPSETAPKQEQSAADTAAQTAAYFDALREERNRVQRPNAPANEKPDPPTPEPPDDAKPF